MGGSRDGYACGMEPYRLFFLPGAGSFAPHVILELLALPHELVRVVRDSSGAHVEPEGYLELNSTGRIPTLITPQGEIVTESMAICLSLADTDPGAGLTPAVGDPGRVAFNSRVVFLTNTVQVAILRARYPQRFADSDAGREDVRRVAERDLVEIRGYCAAWYTNHDWVGGDGPQVDDLFLGMLIRWTRLTEQHWWDDQLLRGLFDRVMDLPASRRALIEEGIAARPPAGT